MSAFLLTNGTSFSQHQKSLYPYQPLPTQIAGHGSEGDGQRAILRRADGLLLKPVQPPPKGDREVYFYTSMQTSKDPTDIQILNHIPEFFGVESIDFTNGIVVKGDYLVLRDITEGFEEPNIMDVKMGARTYGPDATEEKMAQEDSKYVGTKGPFGYSVLGMIVHSLAKDNEVIKYGKSFGKDLKSENVSCVPELFFDTKGIFVPDLLEIVVEKMSEIRNIFERQRKYKLYSSSLLLAYDAAAVKKFVKGQIDRNALAARVNVRLIDFAHVFPANGERDDNFLTGIGNFVTLFKTCLRKRDPSLIKDA